MSIQKIRSLFKKDDGATAVEFGLLAIPFIYMLVGILEICMMFAAGAVLEGGTGAAGRLVRTGQVQAEADPEGAFRDALCDHVNILMDCDDLLYEVIDLGAGGFGGASVIEPDINEDGEMNPREFDPGDDESVVLIRAAYYYPILSPIFADLMSDAPNNTKLFISTIVIQNEPYQYQDGE